MIISLLYQNGMNEMLIAENKLHDVRNVTSIGNRIDVLRAGLTGLETFREFCGSDPEAKSRFTVEILKARAELFHWQKQYDSLVKRLA